MKKRNSFYLFAIFIPIFSLALNGCGFNDKNPASLPSTQTTASTISSTEAKKIAEKFVADQGLSSPNDDAIEGGETVFQKATGAKFIHNQWIVGFTYFDHTKEDSLKGVTMNADGSGIKFLDQDMKNQEGTWEWDSVRFEPE